MESRIVRLLRFVLPQRLVARYMDSKIPLPTDNIFKFVALFSIVLVISGFFLINDATVSSNEVVLEHWIERETLRDLEKPTPEQSMRLMLLDKKVELAVSARESNQILGVMIFVLGAIGIGLGFGYWHKRIQPLADQMARTQLEISRLQVLKLKEELKAKGVDVGDV